MIWYDEIRALWHAVESASVSDEEGIALAKR
jgi:hypothetical protein